MNGRRADEPRVCPSDLVDLAVSLQKDEGWPRECVIELVTPPMGNVLHRSDAISASHVLCDVDVTLEEVDIGMLLRQRLESRCNHMAGATPTVQIVSFME